MMYNSLNPPTIVKRNSSIELLRILAACAVIVLHYNGMGGALNCTDGITHEMLVILECISVCAVDVFIMISGYYLCTSLKRTWDKPIYLLLLLSIIVSASYVLRSGSDNFNLLTLVHSVCPPKNYFVILYVTLYVISPFINLVLKYLTSKGLKILLIVMVTLFSVYPTLIDSYQIIICKQPMGVSTVGAWGQQHGYTIIGFILYYIIGAYIRLNNVNQMINKKKNVVYILLLVLSIYVWFKFEENKVLRGYTLIDYNSLSYTNPLVVALSAFLLVLFLNIHFNNKVINSLSKASFVCYIFHISIMPYLRIESYASSGGVRVFLHLISCVFVIYLVSWLFWYVLDVLLKPLVNRLHLYDIFIIEKEIK